MLKPAAPIVLTDQEREVLSEWARSGSEEHRLVERANVILLAHEGVSTREIARRLRTRAARVSKWRQRFARHRLEGLSDTPRPGKPKAYDEETEKRILSLLDTDPPSGYSQWNGRLLAKSPGRRER